MPQKVFRVQIYTREYEKLRNYYENILSLPLVTLRETSESDRVRVYAAASGEIELIHAPAEMEFPESNGWTVQIEVDDADAYCKEILENGGTVKRGPADQPWGHRNFKVLDPSGLELTFYSLIEKPKGSNIK
ncbi:MAG: VOC family protein [Bacillota bacterium]|nr:VOC family protein [Bacillota bacterium]